jgi:ankyrin repeat protein
MWNPLHFAVYGGHFEVVKFLIEQFNVNIGKTAPKSDA